MGGDTSASGSDPGGLRDYVIVWFTMPPRYCYAVAQGRVPGVYSTWREAEAQVQDFPGARFKKFASRLEAESFVKGNGSVLLGQLGVKLGCEDVATNSASPHAPDALVVFTDGSALNNGRKNAIAGWAAVFPNHPQYTCSGRLEEMPATNNRAEYMGLLKALEIADTNFDSSRRLIVYTDSKLLYDTVTKWMSGWKKNGWVKKDGEPVMNRDLLEGLDTKLSRRRVETHHVRAHTGREDWRYKWNAVADRMARDAVMV